MNMRVFGFLLVLVGLLAGFHFDLQAKSAQSQSARLEWQSYSDAVDNGGRYVEGDTRRSDADELQAKKEESENLRFFSFVVAGLGLIMAIAAKPEVSKTSDPT